MFKGILFDFDGTLADTMKSHYLAWKCALEEHGVHIQARDYYPLEGMRLQDIATELTKGHCWTQEKINLLVRRKKEFYTRKPSVQFYPGVESLVTDLRKQKILMAIVTAGHLDQLRLSVSAEFLDKFNALITGDQVSYGKPHPESYMLGAQILGLDPQQCIAVENSPLGVQSAKQAGVYCIAVCSTVKRDDLVGADMIIDKFKDLKLCVNMIF